MSGGSEQNGTAATRATAWLAALQREPRDAHEAVALLVHAVLLAHGFRDSDLAEEEGGGSVLGDGWGVGGYGGRYRHGRSAMAFEVRATPLGARLRVTGAHNAGDDVATLDLRVADHYDADADGQGVDWRARLRNVDNVATLVLVNVAHRLVPDAAKEGYESGAAPGAGAGGSSSNAAQPTARPQPGPRPLPPSMHDPNDPLRVGPPRGGGGGYVPMPRQPAFPGAPLGGTPAFGRDDLMPQLPGAPHWGPRGGGMGGNLMGPRNFPGGGGMPAMPRPGFPRVPPGARYDPMGPGGMEPDNDELLPPGQRNPRTGPDGGPPDHFFM